ncbi:MAG: lysophospholipid acyltransferase family protein [Candidatus Izemoplasmatales bacterium]
MLPILHLILSAAVAVLYAVFGAVPAGFLGVLAVTGVFLGALVAWLAILLGFLIFVMVVLKLDHTSMFKHRLLLAFVHYYYVVILRVRLIATGLENLPHDENFVIYSNHIEASDPMYLKLVFRRHPVAFISKEVLFKQFLVGDMLASIGCIPISPNADRTAMQSILEGIKRVKGGQPFGIYPEGRRTYSNDIIAFKPGSFKLATKAGADIIPVAVYDMHEINRKGRILPCNVRLHVFPRITPAEYEGIDTVELAKRVETIVAEKMEEFKRLYPTPTHSR